MMAVWTIKKSVPWLAKTVSPAWWPLSTGESRETQYWGRCIRQKIWPVPKSVFAIF